jgi:hypothetical protein
LALNDPSPQATPPEPARAVAATGGQASIRGVALSVASTLVLTAGALALLLALVNRPDWWRGLLAATAVSALSAGLSLAPIAWGLSRPMNQRVAAFFAAMGLRAGVSLGGCVLAVSVGKYPAAPTLLLMVVFYFAILAVETAAAARALWSARD